MSRPAWGAWIETDIKMALINGATGRAPHGARGLKLPLLIDLCKEPLSRPAWGAWIETVQ